MPEELRREPVTDEQIDRWLRPEDEQEPDKWGWGAAWWRMITAHSRWAAAQRAWRSENDPTYRWYRPAARLENRDE